MDALGKLGITLVVGMVFALLFKRLRVPAAFMIGAFVGVALLNLTTNVAWVPDNTKLAIQIIAGAFIGCSMERSDLARLKYIGAPVALMLGSFFMLFLIVGFAIWAFSPLDLKTSLMCAVPGGINDTPIVAADMGAYAPAVALMQLIRQVLGIAIFPLMIATFDKRIDALGFPDVRGNAHISKEARVKSKQKSWMALLTTFIVASAAGFLGKASGIPGFTFAAAIIATLILKLVFDFAYLPKSIKKCCQILAGCYLGTLLSIEFLSIMQQLIVPIVILIAGYTANCFITGAIQSKMLGYGRKEGMLIASPAGASDMALIMDDIGVENTDVVIMQVVRASVVMTLFPQVVNAINFFI
ncbi:MAG: AbrB family transcriptional regulator [Coriobacteriia bacterium]|nr:AbrB family transcriptional regulator [Coriobacteriia bacterium]